MLWKSFEKVGHVLNVGVEEMRVKIENQGVWFKILP